MKKRYNFDALMEPVARRVWGEPNHTKEGIELRWGSRGSRRVNLKMGSWANEKCGTGGKLLKFLKFELQLETWPEQREWLENGGFIPRRRGAGNGAGGYVSGAPPSIAPSVASNGGGAPPTPPVAPNALAAPAEARHPGVHAG